MGKFLAYAIFILLVIYYKDREISRLRIKIDTLETTIEDLQFSKPQVWTNSCIRAVDMTCSYHAECNKSFEEIDAKVCNMEMAQ